MPISQTVHNVWADPTRSAMLTIKDEQGERESKKGRGGTNRPRLGLWGELIAIIFLPNSLLMLLIGNIVVLEEDSKGSQDCVLLSLLTSQYVSSSRGQISKEAVPRLPPRRCILHASKYVAELLEFVTELMLGFHCTDQPHAVCI